MKIRIYTVLLNQNDRLIIYSSSIFFIVSNYKINAYLYDPNFEATNYFKFLGFKTDNIYHNFDKLLEDFKKQKKNFISIFNFTKILTQ